MIMSVYIYMSILPDMSSNALYPHIKSSRMWQRMPVILATVSRRNGDTDVLLARQSS